MMVDDVKRLAGGNDVATADDDFAIANEELRQIGQRRCLSRNEVADVRSCRVLCRRWTIVSLGNMMVVVGYPDDDLVFVACLWK